MTGFIVKVLALFAVLIGSVFATDLVISSRKPALCEEPLPYYIGSFDKRFGISLNEFQNALLLAEAVWEEPLGLDLFAYSLDGGGLVVNLAYDYRQETTEALSGIEDTLTDNRTLYNTLQGRYDSLKSEHSSQKSIYEARLASFNTENALYEARVDKWDKGPRTSKDEFKEIEGERDSLQRQIVELKKAETLVNQKVYEINQVAEELNRLAKALNINVETYNTIGTLRGETFTGGLYYQSGEDRSIDIYEFSSKDKLVRVLAHEFGHALGLEHLEDEESIMYFLNQSDKGALSAADIRALKQLCEVE